ncbi:MAG: choice-of-anchor J domain-containing protein [Bacteroidales bacterium]|nr:choice-of-anchor J domain-containing protein [Bacteroidales bacterium]
MAQETILIGDDNCGNNGYNPPVDVYENYYLSQQIFPASAINIPSGSVISKIAFKKHNGGQPTRDWSIYMMNSEAGTSFAGGNTKPVASSDRVYSGSFDIPAGDDIMVSFDLSTEFIYEGGDLILTIADNTGSGGGDVTWHHNSIGTSVMGSISSGYTEGSYSFADPYSYSCDVYLTYMGGMPDPLSLTVSTAKETIYSDQNVQLSANAEGGSGNYTYSWSPAAGLSSSTSATPTFTPSAAGTYTFTCTVSDGTETASADVTVTVEDAANKPSYIAIGTETGGNEDLPIQRYYNYSISQQIYTSTEIGSSKDINITSIAFKDISGVETTRNIEIYMRNTTASSCETNAEIMNSDELCWNGNVTFAANDWTTITLQTPFEYEVGKNVLLCVVDKTGSYLSSLNFAIYNSSEYSFYQRNDNYPYSATGSDVISGQTTPQKNCIRLEYEVVTRPFTLTASAATETIYDDETVQLIANATGGTNNYTYSWSPATGLDDATIANPTFTPSAAGTYTFTCTVSDGTETLTADVTVTVEKAPTEVVIGSTGGDASVLPGYNYYNYSISQQIYTSSELGITDGSKISSISFMPQTVNQSARNWSVYLFNTTKSKFDSNTDFVALSESDCLYTGDVYFVANQWTTIEFSNQFVYDGDNILVCVKDNKGSYSYASNNKYYSIASSGDLLSVLNYNDNYAYNVANFVDRTQYSTNGNRSVIKLEYQEGAPKAPKAPVLTASVASETSALLSWNSVNGALGYRIYNGSSFVAETESTSYTITKLTTGAQYCYTVSAYNEIGESELSNQECVTPEKIRQYRIQVSTSTHVHYGKYLNINSNELPGNSGNNTNVNVSAYAESNNQIFTLEDAGSGRYYLRGADGYYIKCGTNNLGKAWNVYAYSTTEKTPILFDYVDGSNFYLRDSDKTGDNYFKVENGNIFCNAPSSNTDVVTWVLEEILDLEPETPAGLVATEVLDDRITLSWNAAENATGYNVYKNGELVANVTETTYTVTGLDANTEYTFYVIATRGSNESEASGTITVSTTGPTAPTAAPTVSSVASTGEAAITLTWDEVEKATYYNVYRSGVLIAENVTELTYTDRDNLDLLTNYCYTVKAANEIGESNAFSNETCAQTFDGIPTKIIGEGTYASNTTRIPTYTYNNFSVSQQIYTQAEIGLVACEISKIAFYQKTSYNYTRNFEIYMVNTDKESFDGNYDWVNMSVSNKVFDGEYTFATGWCEFTLDKDFSYEGGNILLCVIDKTDNWTGSSIQFAQNQTTGVQAIYKSGNSAYDASNLYNNVNGSRASQNNQIKLIYTILPDGVTATPEQVTFANAIRGGNYWSGKDIYSSVEKVSLKAKNTAITNISLDDNSFFTIPANIDLTADPVEFNIGHKANPTAGTKIANLIVTHSTGTTSVPLSATVYEPATADVFEKAQTADLSSGSYSNAPTFANLHDDYILPNEVNEGNTPDAVYQFVLSEDAILDINITGTNAVTALYKGDFNGNGPSNDNNYQLSSTKFFFDFENGDFSGLTLKDADGDGRNWEIYSGGYNSSNYCAISYSYNDASYYPENYIITDKKYYITESSTLSFQATSHQSHSYLDGYTILVSENGNNFEEVTSNIVGTVDQFSLQEIDLSAYAGRELYIAINHYTDDKYNLRIDDLRLSDGTDDDAQSDIYPAGTYYLVAAAEDAFTVNITKEALPAPEAITYTSPEKDAKDQVNPVLSFELGKYTTEYQVLFGETNPPAVVKDWTAVTKSEYINSFQTEGLDDNKKYYWQIKARNSSGTTDGEVRSFTTPLNKPTNVVISDTEIFSDEETTITWEAAEGALYYNVYVNDEKHNNANITETSYVLSGLSRRIDPYDVTVTAVHTLGESSHTEPIDLKVSGNCDLTITVVNTTDVALEGAELSLYGINEFGETVNYGLLTTDENGQVSQRVNLLKSGESYYVNVVKAPYTTITDFALVPDYYMSENGNVQLTVTMNLPAPANFRAENDKIYEGDDVVLNWDEVAGATAYNVYVDGVLNAEVSGTTHTISGLEYNPTGYNVTVTTMLPEGESIHSDVVNVKVGGTFTLVINVKDNNENTLADADVTITLEDYSYEFDAIGNYLPTNFAGTTDADGKASFTMPLFDNVPGNNIYYTVAASKTSYENSSSSLGHFGYAVEGDAFITNGGVYEFDCTLSLAAPENFKANKEYYIEGGIATLTWDVIDADNLLGYNVYYEERDEETYEQTYVQLNDEYITSHRFVVENLEYGYQTYCLTAVYDLGESPKAYTQVQVTGYGSISGIVTDESSNPISGATVMITGKDQFDDDQSYILYTDANGRFFSNEIMPSYWDESYQYSATVSKADYFNNYYSPIYVEYGIETNIGTIVLQAKPSVDITVTAALSEDYNGDEYVDITWGSVANAERYNVYRKDLSNAQVTQLNEYNITWTSYSDNNWMSLPNGDYQYGVSAFMKNISTESFENLDTIPAGWKLDTDLLDKPWRIYTNNARTGSQSIYRYGESYDSEFANHIIMNPIDMTEADNATLSFYYVNEGYGGDWTNTLSVSAREFGTSDWNEEFSTNTQTSSWTEVTLNLNAYAGKRVEVRFSARSNGGKYVAIDDITVTLPAKESKINWSSILEKEGIEFTGSGDWNTAGNWNTGVVPGEKDHVAIRGNAVINGDVTVKTLTIIEGGSLTVEEGTLTATEGIVNNIASAFVIEEGAQVRQSKNDVMATFNMNVEAPTSWDSENNEEGWQFIASPMKNVKTSSFETDGTDFDLFKYDGEKAMQWVNYKGHNEDVISGATYLFDFATGFDSWGVIDANGDGYSWGHILTDELHSEYMMGRPEGYDDAGCLFNEAQWYDLDTYTQVNVSPDDYLVAPYMMNIGKYSALRFKMKGYSSMTETPEISVLVSLEDKATGEYVPADFTTVGIAPQINAVWEEVIISLEEYAGENVRVAIRHNVQDSWNTAVIIDKVELANIAFETEFQQGRGYLASYETTSTVEFAGVLSNETGFTFNEVNTFNKDDYYANFYLLGNPFAFNMNWENVTAEGLASGYSFVALDGSYDYAVDGEIKVGDGFFVKVTGENPSLSYSENNGMGMRNRRTEKSSFINLIASGKAGSDNVIINFAGNEEEGFAKLENFNKDIAEIYVKGEGRRYGIMNFEKDVEEIEVYFDAKRMGEYTIEAVAEGKFQSVVLVDRSTGVETELLTDSYTFKALTNDRPDRFVIRMSNNIANDNFVYQSGDELIINAEGTVEIIDIMGRIVYSSNIVNENHRVNTSRFDNAAYIVRVLNTNEIKTQKVVIY